MLLLKLEICICTVCPLFIRPSQLANGLFCAVWPMAKYRQLSDEDPISVAEIYSALNRSRAKPIHSRLVDWRPTIRAGRGCPLLLGELFLLVCTQAGYPALKRTRLFFLLPFNPHLCIFAWLSVSKSYNQNWHSDCLAKWSVWASFAPVFVGFWSVFFPISS